MSGELTLQQKKQVLRAIEAGATQPEAARAAGVSKTSVRRLIVAIARDCWRPWLERQEHPRL
jgi:response regulator of citrate/malate metabolism